MRDSNFRKVGTLSLRGGVVRIVDDLFDLLRRDDDRSLISGHLPSVLVVNLEIGCPRDMIDGCDVRNVARRIKSGVKAVRSCAAKGGLNPDLRDVGHVIGGIGQQGVYDEADIGGAVDGVDRIEGKDFVCEGRGVAGEGDGVLHAGAGRIEDVDDLLDANDEILDREGGDGEIGNDEHREIRTRDEFVGAEDVGDEPVLDVGRVDEGGGGPRLDRHFLRRVAHGKYRGIGGADRGEDADAARRRINCVEPKGRAGAKGGHLKKKDGAENEFSDSSHSILKKFWAGI